MSSVYLNPEINGIDNGTAGWYKLNKYNNELALRVSSSNIGLLGEIRFNKNEGIFQGYDGNIWVNFRDNLIINEKLQIPQQIALINSNINDYNTKIQELTNIKLENMIMHNKFTQLINEYQTKLHNDYNNPSIIKKYKYIGNDISIGNIVIFIGDNENNNNLVVCNYNSNSKNLNIFREKCNIAGIVISILDNEYCDVIIIGPSKVNLVMQSEATEFQKSADIKNGVMVILDSSGKIYQPARKPLNDFIQIGFSLENTSYDITNNKMINIWVKPMIHIL